MEHLKVNFGNSLELRLMCWLKSMCNNVNRVLFPRYSRSRGAHIRGSSWHSTGEKVIRIINRIVAIRYVNTVTNATWIVTNYSGTYEKSITSAIFVMLMVRTIFTREYFLFCVSKNLLSRMIQIVVIVIIASDTGTIRVFVNILSINIFCAKKAIAKRTFSRLFFARISI